MLFSQPAKLLLLLTSSQLVPALPSQDSQVVFKPSPKLPNVPAQHVVDHAIIAALEQHSDPVDALVSLQPELETELAEARLIQVLGEEGSKWMKEGDKMRLRREGKKFMDITEHQEFYEQQVGAMAGKARES